MLTFIKNVIYSIVLENSQCLKTSIAVAASEAGKLCMTTEYGDYICIYKYLF